MAKIVTITNPLTGQPAQVDQLDHTAQQIDDGLNIARGVSNPNLLDNWYFANPIDQRGGYVVKPNAYIYGDTSLTTPLNTTDAYETVEYVNASYCILRIGGGVYYVSTSDCVRGYTGAGYGIDRWRLFCGALLITDNGYNLKKSTSSIGYGSLIHTIDNPAIKSGMVVTFSALTTTGLISKTFELSTNYVNTDAYSNAGSFFRIQKATASSITIEDVSFSDSDPDVIAVKLELGTTQTLAHQDENGVWVPNEIPDYGEQLARCQRYFQTFATESLRPTNALDFRPVMRTITALSTITVGGKTLYTASADL